MQAVPKAVKRGVRGAASLSGRRPSPAYRPQEVKILQGPGGDPSLRFDQVRDCQLACDCFLDLLGEVRGRFMSRALCLALGAINDKRKTWWDAWRRAPYERRALYHMADAGMAGKKVYLWIHHCPVLSYEDDAVDENLEVLEKARMEAARISRVYARRLERHGLALAALRTRTAGVPRDDHMPPPPARRILRPSIPRGGGKGTFVRIVARKTVHESLFPDPDDPGRRAEYAGAFVTHLSFSIEFSSVARALTRFFARQAVKLKLFRTDRAAEVSKGISDTAHELLEVLKPAAPNADDSEALEGFKRCILTEFSAAEWHAAEESLNRILNGSGRSFDT